MSALTPVELLRAARALIDTPDKWCKGTFTRGKQKCIVAAFWPLEAHRNVRGTAFARLRELTGMSIGAWNDLATTTHADVMAAFDRAIAAEEAAS